MDTGVGEDVVVVRLSVRTCKKSMVITRGEVNALGDNDLRCRMLHLRIVRVHLGIENHQIKPEKKRTKTYPKVTMQVVLSTEALITVWPGAGKVPCTEVGVDVPLQVVTVVELFSTLVIGTGEGLKTGVRPAVPV